MIGYWWCERCKVELPGVKVTSQERCEDCGNHVDWFDMVESPSEHISELKSLVRELAYELEEATRILASYQCTREWLDVEVLAAIGMWLELVTKAKEVLGDV